MKTLGERLKYLMKNQKSKKVTQKEIAAFCDVSQQTVQKWANDIILPSSKNMQKLADYFNVSVDYLLQGKENPCFSYEEIDMQDEIAMRVIEERTHNGYSQQELANALQINIQQLKAYEFGKQAIPADFLAAIFSHGFDIQYILTGRKSEPKDKTNAGHTNIINSMERNVIQGNVSQINER